MKKLQLKYKDEDKCMLAQKLGLGPGWKVDFYESGKRYWVTPQEKRITEWKEVARWHEEQNLPVPPFFRKENGAQNMEFFLTHDATLPIKRQMNLLEYMSMRRATTDENAQENAQGETAKTAGTTEDTERARDKANAQAFADARDKASEEAFAATLDVRPVTALGDEIDEKMKIDDTTVAETNVKRNNAADARVELHKAAETRDTDAQSSSFVRCDGDCTADVGMGVETSKRDLEECTKYDRSSSGKKRAEPAGRGECDEVLNEHPWSMRREKDDNLANEELEPRREISADVVEDGNVANEELEPRREISADVVELLRLPTSIYCTETEPIKSMNLKLSLKSFLEAVHEGLSEEECYAKICVPIDEFDEYLFSAPDITSRAELPTTT
eukprot:GEMP01050078.1.p1 GENE.GEMP01050078.1~~GEMP01050078.1.p1  ORF type:complete len:387 (+),score=104.77 GEMP01050078.1:114-1274(+)